MKNHRQLLALLFCLAVTAIAPPLRAETVELTLPSRLVARAEFRQGDADKPAVLLLHGFLQTHQFPTIHRLTDGLAGDGYTVLAPTLSLGLPYRAQSMACEAIHRHTVGDDVAELDAWVKWLKARKVKEILLAGHSMGSITSIAYLTGRPDRGVTRLIGISIIEGSLKHGEQSRAPLIRRLRDEVRRGRREVEQHQFSFCQQYYSTPASLLSYLEWGPERILAGIDRVKVPVSMIMGSRDDRLGADWIPRLRKTRARVIVIDGANHFMDGQYEFDLYDQFLAEVKRPSR
ncbi:MAG: alpha/beta fold hydrolase [Pseudomonadota bacterium]